jgi:hypothetical protein
MTTKHLLEEAYEEFTEEFLAQQEEDKALAEECSMFLQRNFHLNKKIQEDLLFIVLLEGRK